jgi:hypothetical protein
MEFIEKDLESIIWDNAQSKEGRKHLYNRGLNIKGKLFRQVYIGGYGIADLISVEIKKGRWGTHCIVTIYELKKDMVNIDTLTQAFRYHTGIKRFIDARYGDLEGYFDLTINVILIGKTIDAKSDFVFLLNNLIDDCTISVYTYKYNIDGLFFEEECGGWYSTKEKFDSVDFDITEMSMEDKKQILGILNAKK